MLKKSQQQTLKCVLRCYQKCHGCNMMKCVQMRSVCYATFSAITGLQLRSVHLKMRLPKKFGFGLKQLVVSEKPLVLSSSSHTLCHLHALKNMHTRFYAAASYFWSRVLGCFMCCFGLFVIMVMMRNRAESLLLYHTAVLGNGTPSWPYHASPCSLQRCRLLPPL